MKLPNWSTSARWGLPSVAFMILLVGCLERVPSTRAHYQQEPIATNEIATSPKSHHRVAAIRANFSQFSRDVTDLRLSPDLRSIKLRWSYKHSDENRPESFRIRYCELTSWMTEIKCRQREMPVRAAKREPSEGQPQPAGRPPSANDSNFTVITMASVQSVAPHVYETQIFDLRALTNYTFHVQVARFVDESAQDVVPKAAASTRQRPSRRLDFARDNGPTNLISADSVKLARIETTKPFSAEAVKCLADSSEVLVNTGRYFGGRISVEGQQDGRCQLIGNKSSEQSIYSFHIDHKACQSRIMDGKRIETMILVHENKDLLTHNTARFLVQCNIGQESFTVRASISLPKVVNNLGTAGSAPHARPALITPLASKPSLGNTDEQSFDRVHLGSMPGVYRLIRADTPATGAQALINSAASPTSNYVDGVQTTAAPSIANLATTTSSRQSAGFEPIGTSTSRSQRQSKGLTASELLPPKPVDVSSRVLFVERAGEASVVSAPIMQRDSRLMLGDSPLSQESGPVASLRKHQSSDHSNGIQEQRQPVIKRENSSKLTLWDGASAGKDHEDVSEPVIMTNNHRVAGDFIGLEQHLSNGAEQRARPNDQLDGANDFSIKYSANKVDGYALNKVNPTEDPHLTTQTSQTARSRSGRMRQIDTLPSSTSARPSTTLDGAGHGSRASIESRMGDLAQTTRLDALAAEASNQSEQVARLEPSIGLDAGTNSSGPTLGVQPTLAHNITGAIIRWSLRTLGNLARKSLESLAVDENADVDAESGNREIDTRPSTEPSPMGRGTIAPPTNPMARTKLSSQQLQPKSSDISTDGFIVNSRPLESGSTSTAPAKSSERTPSIGHQTSMGLVQQVSKGPDASDQMRRARHQQQESEVRQAHVHLNSKQRAGASKFPVDKPKSAEVKQGEQQLGVSDRYSKEGLHSLWPLYSLWVLCGLISLIVVAIYFVMMSFKHRASFSAHIINSLRHQDEEVRKPSGRLVARLSKSFERHNTDPPVLVPPCSSNLSKTHSSIQTANPFVSHSATSEQLRGNSANNRQTTLAYPTSLSGSTATRSTSAASSSLSSPSERQHYCKEQEQYVVYTDYLVLTDDNSSMADDHECLTRSGRRRRPPKESFA